MTYCNSCGAQLAPGAAHCSNCGAPTLAYYSNTGTPPEAPTVTPSAFTVPQQSLPSTAYGSNPYASPTIPSSQQNPYTPPPPYVPPPPYGTPQTGPQPAYPPPLTPASAQGQKPPRRFSPGLAVLLIIIVVLIIVGSALIYYATVYQPNQQHAQATATAVAQATETAHAQATSTALAQARINATATAAAANPYTHSGTLVFVDPLSDNSKGVNWAQDPLNCGFMGGAYHVKAPDPRYYDDCLANDSNYSNFTFEVQMQIMQGDGGGLVFRDLDSPQAYRNYALDVYQNGSYNLFITNGSSSAVLSSGNSTAINLGLGQINLIAVVAQGNTITIYINHQQVASTTDSTFNHGKIGFEAIAYSSTGHATEVVFSNARVWAL
jgi:type II secretory pathway pseudopilin PulG